MWMLLVLQIVTWERVQPPVLHAGTWQSCDGEERVLEHRVLGRTLWSLHMGPNDEFALYRPGAEPPDGDHDHEGTGNLLGPAYRVSMLSTYRGVRRWAISSLKLWISVVRAGGSRQECESFFIRIEEKR